MCPKLMPRRKSELIAPMTKKRKLWKESKNISRTGPALLKLTEYVFLLRTDGRWCVLPIHSRSSSYVSKLLRKKACRKFATKWNLCSLFEIFAKRLSGHRNHRPLGSDSRFGKSCFYCATLRNVLPMEG